MKQFSHNDFCNEREGEEGKGWMHLPCQELNKDQSLFSIWYQIPSGVTNLSPNNTQILETELI